MTKEEKIEEKINLLKSVINLTSNTYFSKDWILENIFKSKSSIRKIKIKKILNNE